MQIEHLLVSHRDVEAGLVEEDSVVQIRNNVIDFVLKNLDGGHARSGSAVRIFIQLILLLLMMIPFLTHDVDTTRPNTSERFDDQRDDVGVWKKERKASDHDLRALFLAGEMAHGVGLMGQVAAEEGSFLVVVRNGDEAGVTGKHGMKIVGVRN